MKLNVVNADGETIHTIGTVYEGAKANAIYCLALFLFVIPPEQRDAALTLILSSASSNPEDMAEVFGCQPSTVVKRLTKARTIFKRAIETGTIEARHDIFASAKEEKDKLSAEWEEFFNGDIRKLPALWGMSAQEERRRPRI